MYPKRVIVGDARLAGIPILPVDVNASAGDWCVERLPQLPGEGLRPGCVRSRESARPRWPGSSRAALSSLRDLWERAAVSRPVTERLVLVGALDSLYDPDEPDAGPGEPRAAEESRRAGEPHGVGKPGGAEESGEVESPCGVEEPHEVEGPHGAGEPPSRRDLLARVGVLDRRTRPSRRGPGSPSPLFPRSVPAKPHKKDTKTHDSRDKSEEGRRAAGEGRAVAGGRGECGRLAGSAGLVEGMVAGGSQSLLDLDADRNGSRNWCPRGNCGN